ncbi:hypothetical protein AALO_G00155250 [Alosa alosa]|uniref:Glycoside hydrolase family 65 central catalytic domain-containing protein n=1 Tax=Alosa alosa TaxID=278164 RepID=A0AAV6GIY3_9TELE|nr:hypothetical protein AALO_G00155250 [Alosa alosa]
MLVALNKSVKEKSILCGAHSIHRVFLPEPTHRRLLFTSQRTPMMASDPSDPYIFTTATLPPDSRFLPPLANGLLGWRVYASIMHMGGIYNGQGGDCHRADVPCPLAVKLRMDEEEEATHNYSLDTRTGMFTHMACTERVCVSQMFYAHRLYPNLLVMEVLMVRQVTSQEPITVQFDSSFRPQSKDIVFQEGPDYRGAKHIFGQTQAAEVPGGSCPSVHLIWTPLMTSLTLQPEQSQSRWGFLLAVAGTEESSQSAYDMGLQLMADGNLRPSHNRAWADFWLGSRLEIAGEEPLSRALIGCLFYLLSAFPSLNQTAEAFGGVSPGGLSNGGQGQDYWGHVFWDQDTWMYPSIALFYPSLARTVLEYRVRTLEGARANAEQQGYKGVKFPWESATSGREVCPEDIYGEQEIHINGDVIQAFQHYYYLTQDLDMFKGGRGSEVVWGVADYWVSRVTWSSEDQSYHIKGVMPPDEYYYNVDDSVFTKHADVVLLGYPLGLPMSSQVRRNDLEAYEPVTDPRGPAMTWGMFAVAWMELGETERAQKLLEKCYKNIQGPFQVWSESSDGSGAVNFLTGMGGFLQAVLFGYTGFRVQKDCLSFSPVLTGAVAELSVTGVSYLGNKLNWLVKGEEVSVKLWEKPEHAGKACALEVVLKASGTRIPLTPGQTVTFPREAGELRRQDSGQSCWPI